MYVHTCEYVCLSVCVYMNTFVYQYVYICTLYLKIHKFNAYIYEHTHLSPDPLPSCGPFLCMYTYIYSCKFNIDMLCICNMHTYIYSYRFHIDMLCICISKYINVYSYIHPPLPLLSCGPFTGLFLLPPFLVVISRSP